MRTGPFPREVRTDELGAAAGEERPVRDCLVRHTAAVLDGGAGDCDPGRQAALHQAAVPGQAAAAAAARGRHLCVREHDALPAHAHQPEALRGLHRVLGQGQGNVPPGPGRTHTVRAAGGQYEVGLQREEKAHAASQGEVRLGTALLLLLCFFVLLLLLLLTL